MPLPARALFGLEYDEVQGLSRYLAETGGIRVCPSTHEEWDLELMEVLGREAYGIRSRLFREYQRFPKATQVEQDFYDLLAKPPYDAVVWSPKRAYLIDGAVAIASLYRFLGLTGSIAEIGCYTGLISLWLWATLGVEVHGYDRSAVAIERARFRLKDQEGVTFKRVDYLQDPPHLRHSLVFSADSHPCDRKALKTFLRWIHASLSAEGVFVWIGNLAHDLREVDVPKLCVEAGFGYVGSCLIGGWLGDGEGFQSKNLLVLRADGDVQIPPERTRIFQDHWPAQFPAYANDPAVGWAQKTQAYFHSRRA